MNNDRDLRFHKYWVMYLPMVMVRNPRRHCLMVRLMKNIVQLLGLMVLLVILEEITVYISKIDNKI